MDTIIEQLIVDFQERPLASIKPRLAELPQIAGKIDTVIGMRRSGKTSFFFQIMQQQLKKGHEKEGILYINFEDERLLPLAADQLHLIPETYYRMYPAYKKKKAYFFFDEIQNIPGWELFIRRLLDTENVQIALTGSSAKLLSKEIATALRGRAITTEIYPFSFKETLFFENPAVKFSASPGAAQRAWLSNRLREYLIRGGFPEVQALDEIYRIRILQEYVNVVILRDVIERHHIANVQVLRVMVRSLLSAPATLFSINKFYNDLKSQGLSCGKAILYDYLDYLNDAYLIFPIPIYSRSERVRRTNPQKIYLIDTGFITAFQHQAQSDKGHVLENFVFLELRRRGFSIAYYRTENRTEVDFITTTLQGEQTLYQVALNIEDPKTRDREIQSLEMAMTECGLTEGTIITLEHRETIKLKNGVIEVLPVWQWAVSA